MVMGDRAGVRTAPLPVTLIDATALAGQMVAALARVPFRRPFSGNSTPRANLGKNVTREVIRSFLGNTSALPLDEFRSLERLLDALCGIVLPPFVHRLGVDERPLELGGVPGLLYVEPTRPPEGVILYLHGGGFIGTSPRMYAAFVARLCRETSCAVFVADYRLAPEFPYPAGMQDAVDVLVALRERGAPRERLFIAGDSSGGALANTVLLSAPHEELACTPAGVILFSPEVDLRLDEPSIRENSPTDILPWNIPTAVYLHGADPNRAYFDQIRADLSRFPPTFVSWGGAEMFRDAIRVFVEHLRASGVVHDAHEAAGMFHVFAILMPWAEESRAVYSDVARFARDILAGAPLLAAVATRA
jgi:epsilon-lactone hydrolase